MDAPPDRKSWCTAFAWRYAAREHCSLAEAQSVAEAIYPSLMVVPIEVALDTVTSEALLVEAFRLEIARKRETPQG